MARRKFISSADCIRRSRILGIAILFRFCTTLFPGCGLKAWTAAEIDYFAKEQGWSHARVLEDLRSVGLGSLPGGGAEIFAPEIRKIISPKKADAETWLAVHQTAPSARDAYDRDDAFRAY